MKSLLIIFFFFFYAVLYSQNKSEINLHKGRDLYIEVPSLPKYKSSDKNVIIETYLIEIGVPCNGGKKVKFEVLSSGILTKHYMCYNNRFATN